MSNYHVNANDLLRVVSVVDYGLEELYLVRLALVTSSCLVRVDLRLRLGVRSIVAGVLRRYSTARRV